MARNVCVINKQTGDEKKRMEGLLKTVEPYRKESNNVKKIIGVRTQLLLI